MVTDPELLLSCANWSQAIPDPVTTLLVEYLMAVYGLGTTRYAEDLVNNASAAQWGKAYMKNISATIHASELMYIEGPKDRHNASFIEVSQFPPAECME